MVARVSEQESEEMKFETSEHLDLLRYGFDQGRARCDGSGSGVVLVGICFAYVCCLFVAAAYLWQRDVLEGRLRGVRLFAEAVREESPKDDAGPTPLPSTPHGAGAASAAAAR